MNFYGYVFFFVYKGEEQNRKRKQRKSLNRQTKISLLGRMFSEHQFLRRSFISADKWIDNLGSDEASILAKKSVLIAFPQRVNDSNIVEAYHVLYVLDESSINVIIYGWTGNKTDAEKRVCIAH